MSKTHIHPVPADFKAQTLMDRDTYEKWYAQSINDPDTFWADRAREFLDWKTP
jgi:acetyl-CoA synthetase